jgi:hypothetical protein
MSLLTRLAGIPSSLKDSWKRTFGDADVVLDDDNTDDVVTPATPKLSPEEAFAVLGLPVSATLDQVRQQARSRAHGLHAAVVARDPEASAALERLAQASELAEELLLPALRGSAPVSPVSPGSASAAASPATSSTSMTTPRRQRATARSTP